MDFVYFIDLSSYIGDKEIKSNGSCICSLSNRNILAFANQNYLYVLPLEKPNELIQLSNNNQTVNMCWSDDGHFLLSVYENGMCSLFNVKTNNLSNVESVYSFDIKEDDLGVIKTFSKSPKLCLSYDKRESLNYLEKFYFKPYNCIKNAGKLSYNGFLMLTKSAVFHICLLDYNTVKNRYEKFEYDMKLVKAENQMINDQVTNQQQLDSFDLVDFSIENDGCIIAAFTNHDINSPIFIYKVNLKLSNDGLSLEGTNELIATVNLSCESMNKKRNLLFTSNESSQSICVVLESNQSNSQVIQIWQPSQFSNNIIGSFGLNNISSEQWNLVKSIDCPNPLSQICISKCSVNFKDLNDSRQANYSLYLLASYANGTCGYINLQNFNQTMTMAIPNRKDQSNSQDYLIPSKKSKLVQEYIVALDQSLTGSIGVGITNLGDLVVIRQPCIKELTTESDPALLNYLQNLYEYCMIAGYDNWDLLINTNPKLFNYLIDRLEDQYQNQVYPSVKRVYFSRHNSLIFSLCKYEGSSKLNKSMEILTKLILNRCMSIIPFAIQLNINLELLTTALGSNGASKNLINNLITPPLLSTTLINANQELLAANPALSQLQTKVKLDEYLNDLLKLDNLKSNDSTATKVNSNINEIVQTILNRKISGLVINQQTKHVLQWIIDISLYLIYVYVESTSIKPEEKKHQYGIDLLVDSWFLNELRKALIYIKLLFAHSAQSNASAAPSGTTSPTSNQLVSLPVLPMKISTQRDLLADLFTVFTKLISRNLDDKNARNDEPILDLCLSVQAETMIRPMDDLLSSLRKPWLGDNDTNWNKLTRIPVDYLFDEERSRSQYPLFDINRLICFERSSSTKTCLRCGNFTESFPIFNNATNSLLNSKTNCLYLQDACTEKCICGGLWILSPLQ